ncbi:class I SAM-dependent methyltransferase [Streptomyces sp. CA-142005]|uniref:class I SAM-dependent methyltransferase n=1 Tax=Streptomyces sp. CA-142005 TaxID=3240052 RepID=UPI003D939FBA
MTDHRHSLNAASYGLVDDAAQLLQHLRAALAVGHTSRGIDGPGKDELHLYETGVAEALTAPDGSFDVVVTSLAVHHLPGDLRHVALREMRRVLRPGGRLLVADFRPPRTRLVRHLVGASAGHVMAEYRVDLLDGLVADAGLEVRGGGDVRPWLRYVQSARPEKQAVTAE